MTEMAPPPSLSYPPPASGLATTSMILGILAIPTCITAVPAIVTGHLAMSQIKQSNHQLGGAGQAKAGLILGYVVVGLYAAIIVIAAAAGMAAPLFIRQHQKAEQAQVMANVRQLGTMLEEYHVSEGKYPVDLHQLESLNPAANVEALLSKPHTLVGEWLYFQGADSEDPSALLLVSPTVGKKNVTLKVDGAVKLMAEDKMIEAASISKTAPERIPAR